MKVLKNYDEILTFDYTEAHRAIDLVGNNNGAHVLDYITPLEDGIIEEERTDSVGFEGNGSYGNYIIINHENGYKTRYAHLQTVNKHTGERVKKGDILGYMGSTGYAFGGHLHLEIILNGEKINPYLYIFGDKLIKEPVIPPVVIPPKTEPKKIFTCEKDGIYYIKLRKFDELYYIKGNIWYN